MCSCLPPVACSASSRRRPGPSWLVGLRVAPRVLGRAPAGRSCASPHRPVCPRTAPWSWARHHRLLLSLRAHSCHHVFGRPVIGVGRGRWLTTLTSRPVAAPSWLRLDGSVQPVTVGGLALRARCGPAASRSWPGAGGVGHCPSRDLATRSCGSRAAYLDLSPPSDDPSPPRAPPHRRTGHGPLVYHVRSPTRRLARPCAGSAPTPAGARPAGGAYAIWPLRPDDGDLRGRVLCRAPPPDG